MKREFGSKHWQSVYRSKNEQQTSWFNPHLDESLRWIDGLRLPSDAPAIDIGGGRSSLAGDLLARGFEDVTVLDLSQAALDQARESLGASGATVQWLAADITDVRLLEHHYGLWHDRATFHFLVEPADRRRYVETAQRSVRAGGFVVLATFAPDGPEKCSGLPVCRYDAASLAAQFALGFERLGESRELHATPFGTEQAFTYVLLRRTDS